MKFFGIKSIINVCAFLLIALLFFKEVVGISGIAIILFVSIFLLFKVICIDESKIKKCSIWNIFSKKNIILIKDIRKVNISDGGLATGLTTISFFNLDNVRIKRVFMQMYLFERTQLAKYLEDKGIIVDGNGI